MFWCKLLSFWTFEYWKHWKYVKKNFELSIKKWSRILKDVLQFSYKKASKAAPIKTIFEGLFLTGENRQ